MQAAIGRLQLRKLPAWTAARQENARRLRDGLRGVVALRIPEPGADIVHACYRQYAFVRPGLLAPGWSRELVMDAILAAGVPCSVGSCSEIYREKAFVDRGWGPGSPLPVARELGETGLAFLVHPTLTPASLDYAVDVIKGVMASATR
jgi:dTDP-4-amino-4,6-dideoxygalactose transaminase